MNAWVASLLSVAIVSLASLGGVLTLSFGEGRVRLLSAILVSFAVGTLLGDAFLHLIPEACAGPGATLRPSLLILAGMLLFFVVEKLLRHRHGPLHRHEHPEPAARSELAAMNVIGDAAHNFLDGLLIAASYLGSPELGMSTTLAVLFHEIPQELGDFGILVHSGLSVRRAVLLNLASASAGLLGAVLALLAGSVAGEAVTTLLVPVAGGGFVYIAAADLIPELHHDRSLRGLLLQASLISSGIAVMGLLTLVE
ncbi:MAG: ZIP family metal transporter [Planctomycetes bacterium]|nr:ZIP family metal transporter [Planctomycetota bacterium]